LALDGVQIPGQKLVRPAGRRTWEGDVSKLAGELATMTNTQSSDWCELTMLGVTEAEGKLKAALRPLGKTAIAEGLTKFAFLAPKKYSDKLTLVPENDSRPAVNRVLDDLTDVKVLPHIASTGE
jgi:hypothetical protein